MIQFIVVPNTGLQLCRRIPVPLPAGMDAEQLFQMARKQSERAFPQHHLAQLLKNHIVSESDQRIETSGWIPCADVEFVFFRLIRLGRGAPPMIDMVIDTQHGAGRMVTNRVDCVVEGGGFFRSNRYPLAFFYVEHNNRPRNVIGSLIMDFGNTASTFVFAPVGSGPLGASLIAVNNCYDPNHDRRSGLDKTVLDSTMILLRVEENERALPWLTIGARAKELIPMFPFATSLYAPKKYVREWPEHLRAQEPTTEFRGIEGQRPGLFSRGHFVQLALSQMLQSVIQSQTNPHFTSRVPEFYPQVNRILLTYPLTWRESDKALFRQWVDKSAQRLLVLEPGIRSAFQVELVCSEPVAVAAYCIWEAFYHFGEKNLALATSFLGSIRGTPDVRLLIVDIGGGSTDIALVEAAWKTRPNDEVIDVTFQLLESMRFNRAGDRLTHIIATALYEFLREKYGLDESLDFTALPRNPALTIHYKYQLISKICTLAEKAKQDLSDLHALQAPPGPGFDFDAEPVWALEGGDEQGFLGYLEPLGISPTGSGKAELRFELTLPILREWIAKDRQSMETNGEPGFMDIFYYLSELKSSLQAAGRVPDLVVLSGRTTRVPFIRDLVAHHVGLPRHRVRAIGELMPSSLHTADHAQIDKLSVVQGAHRFRFGHPIHFSQLPEEKVFKRYIGTVKQTPTGLRLQTVQIKPGDGQPRNLTVKVGPSQEITLGTAFRPDGPAERIGTVSNGSPLQEEVSVEVLNDFAVTSRGETRPHIRISEWVPGGVSVIVDNFYDTGRIDAEPPGLLRRIVLSNQDQWMKK